MWLVHMPRENFTIKVISYCGALSCGMGDNEDINITWMQNIFSLDKKKSWKRMTNVILHH